MIKKIEYIYYIYFACSFLWTIFWSDGFFLLDFFVNIPYFMLGLAFTYLRFSKKISKKRVLIGNIGLFATTFLIQLVCWLLYGRLPFGTINIPFLILGLASTYLRFSKKRVLIGNIGLFATIFLIMWYRYLLGLVPIDFPIGLALCLIACFHGASTNDEVTTKKEFLPVFLLCFLFGYVGVHRFYAGKTVSGILMVATLGGLGFWYIIDLILLLSGNFTDSDGRVIEYNSSSAAKSLSVADELEKFANLRAKGILTEEEFQSKKMALLDS